MELRFTKARLAVSCCVSGLALTSVGAAYAQDASDDVAQEARNSNQIVVTAQKREQTLNEVPIAVSVVGKEALERAQVTDISDLQQLSPNLNITTTANPSATSLSIRGIGTPASATGRGFEQSVGVYIDGVLRGRPGSALQDLVDLERVEILRGPQSTLFGRNNSAGALNIVTQAPEFEFGGSVRVTGGDQGLFRAQASVTGPIVEDVVAAKLSASHNERDGFVENLNGTDLNAFDRQTVRGQLLFTPDVDTSIRIIADWSQSSDTCCARIPIFVGDIDFQSMMIPGAQLVAPLTGATILNPIGTTTVNGVSGTLLDPFERQIAPDVTPLEESESWGVSAQLVHDFGGAELTLLPSFRSFEADSQADADGTDGFVSSAVFSRSEIEEFSFEARLAGLIDDRHNWTLGTFFFDQRIDEINRIETGTQFPAGVIPGMPPTVILTPRPTAIVDAETNLAIESIAVFGQIDLALTDQLTLTGGLRYLDETANAFVNTVEALNLGPPPPGVPLPFLASTEPLPGQSGRVPELAEDELMGAASLNYEFDASNSVYARYARGYKSGGIDLVPAFTTVDQLTFLPETVDAFEIGAKLRLVPELTLFFAAFHQTLNNQQVQLTLNGTPVTLNAAEVESQGIEVEYVFTPLDGLVLSGGVSYLDAKYASFDNAPAQLFSDLPQDLTGEAPPFSPKWTVTGQASYRAEFEDWALTPAFSYQFRSEHSTSLQADDLFANPDTFTLDANITIENIRNGIGLQFWVQNLTDEEIIVQGTESVLTQATAVVSINDPRTWGVTAFLNF